MAVCDVEAVKYKKMPRSDSGWEVIIQPNGVSSFKRSEVTYKNMAIMFIIFVAIVAFITWVMIGWPNGQYDPNPNCFENGCVYQLYKVDKIVITLSEKANYSCFNEKSCYSLFDKMAGEGYGMKYNFIVGSEFPTYWPAESGFKCAVNDSSDTLYINIIRHDQSVEHFLEGVYRVAEVIQKGLKCDIISSNFTIMDVVEENFTFDPEHHLEFHTNDSEKQSFHPKYHSFFNYTTQIKSAIPKINITSCSTDFQRGGMMKYSNISMANNGSETCLEYKPADIVIVSIDRPSATFDFIRDTECLHSGLQPKYNFISGPSGHIGLLNVYKSLGFECGNQFNILKIKTWTIPSLYSDYFSSVDFLKNGINCHKISQNFTFVLKCQADCQRSECSNYNIMSWHSIFHKFRTSMSEWIGNKTDCSFSIPEWPRMLDKTKMSEPAETKPLLATTESTTSKILNGVTETSEDYTIPKCTWFDEGNRDYDDYDY